MSKLDSVIISDVHLGRKVSRAKDLLKELKKLRRKPGFKRLIILGDFIDDNRSFNDPLFSGFPKSHRRVLKYIKALHKHGVEIVWIAGNHDPGILNVDSPYIQGLRFKEFSWESNGDKYLVTHGDRFDKYVFSAEEFSEKANRAFAWFQALGAEDQKFSRWMEKKVTWRIRRHLSKVMPYLAVEYARASGALHIICGHTHIPVKSIIIDNAHYHNTGSWVDYPASYITIGKEGVELHEVK